MENIDRKKKAYDLFKQGYNCAQSVVVAFEDVLDLDRQTLLNVSVGFGGGFGRTRNLCGAVSAIAIVLGLYLPHSDKPMEDKANIYKHIQNLSEEFKKRNASDNCGELLKNVKNLTSGYEPQVRDEEYYKMRPCIKFVLDSVEILDNFINNVD
ncbi:MAG: C-GCAxxG-C-C family protein [Clostridia bacterium]|nr:C-GCAxxG-C-C family protein [Clostridia bacterium]MDE7329283.1 C-GCAxxG-C-C family protein [Clostridia bacterium]